MTPWIIGIALALVLLVAGRRHLVGILRLREALRRVARNDLNMPLLLDLPRGLRSAERDLKEIAERIKNLDQTAAQERFGLSTVLGSIGEGVLIVDQSLRIRLANKGAAGLLNVQGSPEGRLLVDVFRNAEIQRLVRDSLSAGQAGRSEVVLEDGASPRVLELSVSPLPVDAGRTGGVVVLRDVTQIKALERVRREFVANVSHELRTPLTIISGYLETLLEGGMEDPEVTGKSLQVMFKHSERLQHLVDDLLTISQVESRSVPLDVQPLDLRELVRRVIEQLDEPIQAQGAEVLIAPPGDPVACEGDPVRLEQVLFNLLENALKYGNRSGLNVTVRLAQAGPEVLIEVTDNGPGIPYEDQEHIFERFYRVHKHRSRESGGTGLGLSIVKNVVAAHGGTVTVRSAPGAGSTFVVTLPARQHAPPIGGPDQRGV